MNTVYGTRLLRRVGTSCAVLLVACGLSLTAGAAAQATPTHSTDDFGFDTDPGDLCPFAVHLTVHNETDTVRQTTALGTREVDHIVETDTVAAHGKSLQGLPYHWTLTADIDASGHLLSLLAEGQTWRFRLPDGSIWAQGGRANFLTDEHVGSWQPAEGLGVICDLLA
jgi:hypothetical protein